MYKEPRISHNSRRTFFEVPFTWTRKPLLPGVPDPVQVNVFNWITKFLIRSLL